MPFGALQTFISTIQPGRINSFGFYGGEPSIHPLEFDWAMSIVKPYAKLLFVITNGAWSMDTARTKAFLRWMGRRNAQVFVSGTPFHRRHQNQAVLDAIINGPFSGSLFNLKSGETASSRWESSASRPRAVRSGMSGTRGRCALLLSRMATSSTRPAMGFTPSSERSARLSPTLFDVSITCGASGSLTTVLTTGSGTRKQHKRSGNFQCVFVP